MTKGDDMTSQESWDHAERLDREDRRALVATFLLSFFGGLAVLGLTALALYH